MTGKVTLDRKKIQFINFFLHKTHERTQFELIAQKL